MSPLLPAAAATSATPGTSVTSGPARTALRRTRLHRSGTELATAHPDTLGDLALGCLGGGVAGVLVVRLARGGALTAGAP